MDTTKDRIDYGVSQSSMKFYSKRNNLWWKMSKT